MSTSLTEQTSHLPAVKNDVLSDLLGASPETLNPVIATDVYSGNVLDFIFENLISYDPMTGEARGRLAESWTISKDGKIYEFKLREGIFFSDGTPITAEDVKFSYDIILKPKTDAAPKRSYFSSLQKVEIVDARTVRFVMKEPYFRNLIVLGLREILPKHIYGVGDINTHPRSRDPLGSGPYLFSKWESGRLIELKRNPNWWGLNDKYYKNRYNFEKIIFRIITDDAVSIMALKKGDIDSMEPTYRQFLNDFNSPEDEKRFYKLKYETTDGRGYGYIGWNHQREEFSSAKIRRALSMLLPRDEINKKIYQGLRVLSRGPFPAKNPKMDPTIEPIKFLQTDALKLLAEEGFADTNNNGTIDRRGKEFTFDLLMPPGNADGERVALIFRDTLKNAGIEMNIRTLEWTVFLKQVQSKKFDAVMLGWGSSLDSDPFQIWHSSQIEAGSNYVGYKNLEVDRLLEEARRTLDVEKRNQLYRQFTKILAEDAPYTFLFEAPHLLAADRRIKNVLPIGVLGTDSAAWFVPLGEEKVKAAP